MELFVIIAHYPRFEFIEKKRIIEEVAKEISQTHFIMPNFAPRRPNSHELDFEETMELLKTSDFLIADLTHGRPSCYYEVGYVQALKKDVELIAIENEVIYQVYGKKEVNRYRNLDEYRDLIDNIIRTYISKTKPLELLV
ncbi:MAG: hypothetical protein KAX49_01275 [Halanaerobiales bacterium]|nr:hypothetical protein [Halanaerobiales bacterium]